MWSMIAGEHLHERWNCLHEHSAPACHPVLQAPKTISRLRYRGKELPEKLLTATHEMDRLVLVDLEAYKWAQESVSLQRAPQGLQHLAYLRVIGAERFPDAFVGPGSGLPALIALDLAHLGGPGGAADIPNLTVNCLDLIYHMI